MGIYTVGHPVILKNCEFQTTLQLSYFGLMHCRVLPPRDLFHTILPCWIRSPRGSASKVMFVVCHKFTKEVNSCWSVALAQIKWESYWGSPEIALALEENYSILCMFKVLNYTRRKWSLETTLTCSWRASKRLQAGPKIVWVQKSAKSTLTTTRKPKVCSMTPGCLGDQKQDAVWSQ